jgi:hypothetical protein
MPGARGTRAEPAGGPADQAGRPYPNPSHQAGSRHRTHSAGSRRWAVTRDGLADAAAVLVDRAATAAPSGAPECRVDAPGESGATPHSETVCVRRFQGKVAPSRRLAVAAHERAVRLAGSRP